MYLILNYGRIKNATCFIQKTNLSLLFGVKSKKDENYFNSPTLSKKTNTIRFMLYTLENSINPTVKYQI